MTRKVVPLVHEQHFAHATRDTGYKSTTAAVAELIDNSIQAGADTIQVLAHQVGRGRHREIRIAVWDNGSGMNTAELQQALQFGGSTRFNDRSGLGRFGMGLPNASVSQARRVEVFTWRSQRRVRWSYLDLDEIAAGTLSHVPADRLRKTFPDWSPKRENTGTLVVWTKCDRLDYRKATTIEAKLRREIGRIFRHLLSDGVEISVNGKPVSIIDPLFRLAGAETRGGADYLEPLIYRVKVPGSRRVADVVVRFRKLPVEEWAMLSTEEKRRLGIVGGAGVFVVRSGREIAHGWYFMQNKARQNYDDWWRCEVSFPPSLDELFGVTHSKQGIRPSQDLNAILGPEISQIARQLSQEVRATFSRATGATTNGAATRASRRDWRLPRLSTEVAGRRVMSNLEYRIEVSPSSLSTFFDWSNEAGRLLLSVNQNHPFYSQLLVRLSSDDAAWLRRDLETVLIAYARAAEIEGQDTRAFRDTWGDVLLAFLEA